MQSFAETHPDSPTRPILTSAEYKFSFNNVRFRFHGISRTVSVYVSIIGNGRIFKPFNTTKP